MELQQIFDHYRLYISRMSKPVTRYDYDKRLKRLENWLTANNITAVEDIDFSKYLDWLYIDRGVSPRTYNNFRTWCQSFSKWMLRQHYIDADPIENISPLKEQQKMRQPIPASVLRQIKAYLEPRNKHFLLAVMMEYYCFIRPGELSQIRVGDIDTKAHSVYIGADISKNGKSEVVGLNRSVVALMRDLHVLRHPKEWYLFSNRCRPGKTRLKPRMFRDRWARMRKHLGLPKEYQFYSLKDSGIRDLANAEGIVIARDQARHSSVAVTNKYLQGRDHPVHAETIRFKGAL